jgi:hypothetical protein
VKELLLADVVTVATFQCLEDDRGQDGKCAKNEECLVDAVDYVRWRGMDRSGMKSALARPAAATLKLMDICCIVLAMEPALLVCSSVMSA